MQKYRHRHEENRNEHDGVEGDQLIRRLHGEGLGQRRRGQETGRYGDRKVGDAEQIKAGDQIAVLFWIAGIGEPDNRREHSHEDIADTGGPCEQTRHLAARIEDQEDHAERAIDLDADQPLLRHGVDDAADERRPPDEKSAQQIGRKMPY